MTECKWRINQTGRKQLEIYSNQNGDMANRGFCVLLTVSTGPQYHKWHTWTINGITLRKPFYYFKTVLSLLVLCHGEGPFPGSEPNTNVQNRHSKKTIIGLKENVGGTIFTPSAQAKLLKNFYWSIFREDDARPTPTHCQQRYSYRSLEI